MTDLGGVVGSGAIARAAPGAERVPPGKLSWGSVHDFTSAKSSAGTQLKAAVADNGFIYVSDRNTVTRYHADSGESGVFFRTEAPVHSMLVVHGTSARPGRALWCAYADGRVAIVDIETGEPLAKPFTAHSGEVKSMLQLPGSLTVITGGTDFRVKTWTPNGDNMALSGHHHGSVDALVCCAEQPGNPENRSTRVFSGSADGTVFTWVENPSANLGKIDMGTNKPITLSNSKGVSSMLVSDGMLWCGCYSGALVVLQAAPTAGGAFKQLFEGRMHADKVLDVQGVGAHIWTASADKTVVGWDRRSLAPLYNLGDQGSGVKQLLPLDWSVWAVTFKGIKVLTASGFVLQEKQRAAELQSDLQKSLKDLASEKQRVKELELQADADRQRVAAAGLEVEKERAGAAGVGGQLAAAEAKLAAADEELTRVRAALKGAEEARESLRAAVSELEGDVKSTKLMSELQTKELQAEIEKLQSEMQQRSTDHANQMADLSRKHNELQGQAQASNVKNAEMDGAQQRLAARVADLEAQLTAAAADAEASRRELQAEKDQRAAVELALEALRSEKGGLDGRLKDQDARTADMASSLQSASAEAEALRRQLAEATAHSTALQQQMEKVATDGARAAEALDTARAEAERTSQSLAAAAAELASTKVSTEQLAKDKEDLQRMLDQSRADSGDAMRIEQEGRQAAERALSAASAQAEGLQGEVAALKNAAEELRLQLAAAAQSGTAAREEITAMQAKLDAAHAQLDAAHQELLTVGAEREDLRQRVEALEATAREQAERLLSAEASLATDRFQAEALASALEAERARAAELEASLGAAGTAAEALTARAAELEGRAGELDTAVRATREELASTAETLRAEREGRAADAEAASRRLDEVATARAAAEAVAADTRTQLESAELARQQLQDRLQGSEAAGASLAAEKATLEGQLAALTDRHAAAAADLEATARESAAAAAARDVLQEAVSAAEARAAAAEASCTALRAANATLDDEVLAYRARSAEAREQALRLEEQLSLAHTAAGDAAARLAQLTAALEGERTQRQRLEGELDRLLRELDANRGDEDALRLQLALEEMDRLRDCIAQLEAQLDAEREARSQEGARAEGEVRRMEAVVAAIRKEKHELQRLLRGAQKHVSSLPPLEQYQEMEGALKQATRDYQMLLKKGAEMRHELQAKDRELQDARDGLLQLENRVEDLSTAFEALRQERDLLLRERDLLTQQKNRLEQLSMQLAQQAAQPHAAQPSPQPPQQQFPQFPPRAYTPEVRLYTTGEPSLAARALERNVSSRRSSMQGGGGEFYPGEDPMLLRPSSAANRGAPAIPRGREKERALPPNGF